MFTLLTTVVSFLAGNTPKFLEFFQQKSDQKHEIALAQLQMTQQLELQKAGFVAQKELEEIKLDELKIQTDSDNYKQKYQTLTLHVITTLKLLKEHLNGLSICVLWCAQLLLLAYLVYFCL